MNGHKSIQSLDAAIGARLGRARNFRHGLLFLGILAIFAWVAPALLSSATTDHGHGVMCASVMPFLGAMGCRFESDKGAGGGGGGAGDDDPVAKAIIEKINEQKRAVEAIEKRVGELSETKEEAEALKKAVDQFDGLSHDVKTFAQKMAALEKKLANVRREVSGDPLKRLVQDEEMRTLMIAEAKCTYLRARNLPVPKELTDAAAKMREICQGKAVLGTATPGSAYIDTEMLSTVYQIAGLYGRWSGFDVIRPGARTVEIPVDTTDPTMVWATEGSASSEASYAGSKVTLAIRKIYGWIGVSNEMLEDDEIGLANHLATKFARATAKKLDHACFVADGTDDATHGAQTGIFAGGTAYGLPTTIDTIAELDLSHFTGALVASIEGTLEDPSTRWWMHPSILAHLLNVKDANGRSLFLTSIEAPAQGGIGSILGYPVITTYTAPSTVAASAKFAVFGRSDALAVAVRRDLEIASSVDAKFTEDQTVFRSRMRAGVKIKQATAFRIATFGAAS